MAQIDLITAVDVALMRRQLGEGTTFPTTGVRAGDTYLHTALGLHVYTGTLWVQATRFMTTSAARPGLATAQIHTGFEAYETDTNRTWTWSGTAWALTGSPMGVPDTDWRAPTYLNNWRRYDNVYPPARYRKHTTGQVEINGLVTGGAVNTIIFVLPVGYRPNQRILTAQNSGTGISRVDVLTNGEVVHVAGGIDWCTINITFYPDQ